MKRVSDEIRFMSIARKVLEDKTPLQTDIDIGSAWTLVAALQLATRNPGMTPDLRLRITNVGRAFQASIEVLHPEAHELLEKGWNEKFDRRRGS